MLAVPKRRIASRLAIALLGALCAYSQSKPAYPAHPPPQHDVICAGVQLDFGLLKRPAVYHMGEIIQARLTFRSSKPYPYDLEGSPEPRRLHFPLEEIITAEPATGTIDPFSRYTGIFAGNVLGGYWPGNKPLRRDIDVNEWIQFQQPGRYVLRVKSSRIVPMPPKGQIPLPRAPSCELTSNDETLEILAPDPKWEASALEKIVATLESSIGTERFHAASALRYLNTPAAAVALARWYVDYPTGSVNTELKAGIIESRYADVVQSELEKFLHRGAVVPAEMADTLASLELRREFAGRPYPKEKTAAEAWSREYSDRYAALKKKYSME